MAVTRAEWLRGVADNVLTDEVSRHCEGAGATSTMFASKPGHSGAFHQEAFASPPLLQVAVSLAQRFRLLGVVQPNAGVGIFT